MSSRALKVVRSEHLSARYRRRVRKAAAALALAATLTGISAFAYHTKTRNDADYAWVEQQFSSALVPVLKGPKGERIPFELTIQRPRRFMEWIRHQDYRGQYEKYASALDWNAAKKSMRVVDGLNVQAGGVPLTDQAVLAIATAIEPKAPGIAYPVSLNEMQDALNGDEANTVEGILEVSPDALVPYRESVFRIRSDDGIDQLARRAGFVNPAQHRNEVHAARLCYLGAIPGAVAYKKLDTLLLATVICLSETNGGMPHRDFLVEAGLRGRDIEDIIETVFEPQRSRTQRTNMSVRGRATAEDTGFGQGQPDTIQHLFQRMIRPKDILYRPEVLDLRMPGGVTIGEHIPKIGENPRAYSAYMQASYREYQNERRIEADQRLLGLLDRIEAGESLAGFRLQPLFEYERVPSRFDALYLDEMRLEGFAGMPFHEPYVAVNGRFAQIVQDLYHAKRLEQLPPDEAIGRELSARRARLQAALHPLRPALEEEVGKLRAQNGWIGSLYERDIIRDMRATSASVRSTVSMSLFIAAFAGDTFEEGWFWDQCGPENPSPWSQGELCGRLFYGGYRSPKRLRDRSILRTMQRYDFSTARIPPGVDKNSDPNLNIFVSTDRFARYMQLVESLWREGAFEFDADSPDPAVRTLVRAQGYLADASPTLTARAQKYFRDSRQ